MHCRKRILIIKPILVHPRYHLNRTLELAKYFDISWYIYSDDKSENLEGYDCSHHKVISLNKEIPKKGRKIKNLLILFSFYKKVSYLLSKTKYDLVIIHNNKLCFLLPLLSPNNKFALSMGTSAVTKSKIKNRFIDIQYKINTLFFKQIIVGTPWMINKFNLHNKNVITTRWGTIPLSRNEKSFNDLRLLYIGTLTNRRIHETIEGLAIFLKINNYNKPITYDIIGKGSKDDEKLLLETIKKYNLESIVKIHGFLPSSDVEKYFSLCNIGVAYIPITEYYTDVVATKLDEYVVSGLVSIATGTNENKKVITQNNGIIIDDNPEGFAEGLQKIVLNLNAYSSKIIFEESKTKTLSFAVENEIVPKYLKFMED